jgi:hypothetical protein
LSGWVLFIASLLNLECLDEVKHFDEFVEAAFVDKVVEGDAVHLFKLDQLLKLCDVSKKP